MSSTYFSDRRECPRFRLPPMYSSVTANGCTGGDQAGDLHGHVYDVSSSGVRIELDHALEVGDSIQIDLELPGLTTPIRTDANVVWVNDAEDDPGPRRMALRFTDFNTSGDRMRLSNYLENRGERIAA
jgi:hypothetical protein